MRSFSQRFFSASAFSWSRRAFFSDSPVAVAPRNRSNSCWGGGGGEERREGGGGNESNWINCWVRGGSGEQKKSHRAGGRRYR